MQNIQFKAHIDSDGILKVQMPPETKDTDLEIMVIFQPLSPQQQQPHYNAWGKAVTQESTQAAISQMQQLRQEVSIDSLSIPEMMEEGRRF